MWTEIEMTPWDHDDPTAIRAQRVMHALRRFQLAEEAMRARAAHAMGMTETEQLALRYVIRREREGTPVTPTDVSQYMGIKTAAATLLIDRLERAGHLARRPHPTDRRSLVLEATPEAHERIEAIFGTVYGTMMSATADIEPDEAEMVIRYMDHLADTLDGFAAESGETVPAEELAAQRTSV